MRDDEVLLKLRRKYGKDEVFAALEARCSSLEIENGKLKSEIDYLNHEILKMKKFIEKYERKRPLTIQNEVNRQIKESGRWKEKESVIKEKEEVIRNLNKKISQLRIDNRELIEKIGKMNSKE
jgi:uncharacterized coiled-coil protein SlyX